MTAATDRPFTFVHDGKTYKFEKSFDVIRSPRWLSENRRRDELDLAFTILETVAGDEAYEAILDMDPKQFEALQKRVSAAMNSSLGG